jgi:hypothetical protein
MPFSKNTNFAVLIRTYSLILMCIVMTDGIDALAADETKMRFDVPADSAEKSLRLFSTQSSLEVLFATEVVADVRTNAVKGEFTPMEAISRLLFGTSLRIVRDEKNGVLRLSRAAKRSRQSPNKKDRRARKGDTGAQWLIALRSRGQSELIMCRTFRPVAMSRCDRPRHLSYSRWRWSKA